VIGKSFAGTRRVQNLVRNETISSQSHLTTFPGLSSETMGSSQRCSSCGNLFAPEILAEARLYPFWAREDGGCPACVQQNLLRTLLSKGDAALHEAIQTAWPLDAEAAFGVLPTRLRLHADPRFSGQGVTLLWWTPASIRIPTSCDPSIAF
jgi:hypothetical protein